MNTLWGRTLLAALLCAFGGFACYAFASEIDRSLWLDEFGSLWVVEAGFFEVFERTLAFQGQSPFVYLVAWLPIQLLGEAEWVLRLPSLLSWIATLGVLLALGRELGGWMSALTSMALIAVYPEILNQALNARPYLPAVFFTAVTLLGFVRATRTGAPPGRVLFVLGSVGLIYAHYVLALQLLGFGLAYLALPALRRSYRPARFTSDVVVVVLLVLPCVPQLLALQGRSGTLAWVGEPNLWELPGLLWPMAFVGIPGLVASGVRRRLRLQALDLWLLGLVILGHAAALLVLAAWATNFLVWRYMLTLLVPASLLAGLALAALWESGRVPRIAALVLLAAYGALAAGVERPTLYRQDWREAVALLNAEEIESGTPVCFRAGFVEEDLRVQGDVRPVTFSPLRSPGESPPDWTLLPLSYRWDVPGREVFFERTLTASLESSRGFYYLGPRDRYLQDFRAWIAARYPGRFAIRSLGPVRGLRVLQFRIRAGSGSARGRISTNRPRVRSDA